MLVSDVMLNLDAFPVMDKSIIFKECLEVMGEFGLGVGCIVDDSNKLLGIFTDGDLRRKLLKIQRPISSLFIDDALQHSILLPLTIESNVHIESAVLLMENNKVWDLPVVDSDGILKGLLHLHPAIKALLNSSNSPTL